MNESPPDGAQLFVCAARTITTMLVTAPTSSAPIIACFMKRTLVSRRLSHVRQSDSLSWQSFPLGCRMAPVPREQRRRKPSKKTTLFDAYSRALASRFAGERLASCRSVFSGHASSRVRIHRRLFPGRCCHWVYLLAGIEYGCSAHFSKMPGPGRLGHDELHVRRRARNACGHDD